MTTETELLRRYARERSEPALAELVQKRVGPVYHAALRRVGGDAHLAQDVTQQVFIALANQAHRLTEHPALSAWFHTTTRNIAIQGVRAERRRRTREYESSIMHETNSSADAPPDWEKLRINLTEAMDELSERDRAAVLLRFFDGRSFAEVGTQLKLTENTARMRVGRALDKMHAILARRGISSTAAALGAALTAQATQIAPVGIAATVTSAALTGTSLGSGIVGFTFMSVNKLQIGLILTLAAAGVGVFVAQRHTNSELRKEIARLELKNTGDEELKVENVRLKQSARPAIQSAATAPAENASDLSTSRRNNDVNSPHRKESVPLAPGLIPVKTLPHAERTSARTAFSTQLWAAAQGDVDLEQSTITFRQDARAKLEALLASMAEPQRANYGSPEKLMASVLAGSPHPVGGMQVLGETTVDSNNVILQTEWQHSDDGIVHHSNVELQRDEGGWKMVVPMTLVDRAVNYLNGNRVSVPPPAENK